MFLNGEALVALDTEGHLWQNRYKRAWQVMGFWPPTEAEDSGLNTALD